VIFEKTNKAWTMFYILFLPQFEQSRN